MELALWLLTLSNGPRLFLISLSSDFSVALVLHGGGFFFSINNCYDYHFFDVCGGARPYSSIGRQGWVDFCEHSETVSLYITCVAYALGSQRGPQIPELDGS